MLNPRGLYVRTPSIVAYEEANKPKEHGVGKQELKFVKSQLALSSLQKKIFHKNFMHKTPYQRLKAQEEALKRALGPGARVKLKNLMKLHEYNGRIGTVTEESTNGTTYRIELEEIEEGEFSGAFTKDLKYKKLSFRNLIILPPLEQHEVDAIEAEEGQQQQEAADAQQKADAIEALTNKYRDMPLTEFLAKMPDIPTDECLVRLGYDIPNWMTHQKQSMVDSRYYLEKQEDAIQGYRTEFIDKDMIQRFRMESHAFQSHRRQLGELKKRKELAAGRASLAAMKAAASCRAEVITAQQMVASLQKKLKDRKSNLELAHMYATKQQTEFRQYHRQYLRPRTSHY